LVKKAELFFESGSLPAPLSFPCPNHMLFVRERACFLHPRHFQHRQGNFIFKNLFPLSVESVLCGRKINLPASKRSAKQHTAGAHD
jgi:hypothetical protein